MRVIIDTNCLESEELKVFLNSSRDHFAVLPEHTTAEIFRPRSNQAIFGSLSIVCRFPKQVIILNGNRLANRVDPKVAAISNHFINQEETKTFPQFCEMIGAAKNGDAAYLMQIEERRGWAKQRAESTQIAMGDQSEALEELLSNFGQSEIRDLRAGRPLADSMRQTIMELTAAIADSMFSDQVPGRHIHRPPYRYNQFVWRYTLCHVIQMLQLVRNGATRRAPAKARNDHFDNVFATFGTYFNGVMSNDRGVLVTQLIARSILRSLGVRLAIDYLDSDFLQMLTSESAEDR